MALKRRLKLLNHKARISIAVFALLSLMPISANAADMTALDKFNQDYNCDWTKTQIITREQFCVGIAKAFSVEQTSSKKLPFADANEIQSENIKYIAALYGNGILTGSSENGNLYMLPDTKLTKQEAFTLLGRTIKQSSSYVLAYSDVESIADWAYSSIAWFTEKNFISDNTKLYPTNTMTGEQIATIIMELLDYNSRNSVEISSYFGAGSRGLVDGDSATARFTLPYGITVDSSGNITVFDTYNNAIRKIQNDYAKTIAGSVEYYDEYQFAKGDYLDGDIKESLLNRPTSGVYNSNGVLLICDSENSVIRLIKNEKMYTLAGSTAGFSNGTSKNAKFNNPMAIAIDSQSNIYVADTLNHCIRKIDTDGNVSTIAGRPNKAGFLDGSASNAMFLEPSGIAVSEDGKTIYVSDTGNHRIRKIENDTVITIAGTTSEKDEDGYPFGGFKDGNASTAMFNQPAGIALADGVVVITDSGNNRIRAITQSQVITIAGSGEVDDSDGSALLASFDHPIGVYFHNGTLYIADTANNKIKTMPFKVNYYGEGK